jgi:multidrug efflux pump subunit AcrA (membrane-fusion protein)
MPASRSLLLLTLAFALAACRGAGASDDAGASGADTTASPDEGGSTATGVSLPVVADEVTNGDLVLSVNTTGQVRSDAEGRIRSEVAGTVERVLVRPGDRVRKGQPLVQLDTVPFVIDLQEAEVAVKSAQQQYEDLYRPDSAITGEMPSQVRLDAFVIRSGLAAARVRYDRAKLARERATVYAPFSGVSTACSRCRRPAGRGAGAGHPGGSHEPADRGGRARARPAADPGRRAGGDHERRDPGRRSMVAWSRCCRWWTAPRAPAARHRAHAGHGRAAPGMYADVRLEAQRLPNRRLVPTRAIIERDGRPSCSWCATDARSGRTSRPGRTNGNRDGGAAGLVSGMIPVNPGDQVIIEGHLTLTHDAPVRVVAQREREPGAQD